MEYEVGADELLSAAVVRAVSAAEGRDPLDLPPLDDILATAALDLLFASDACGQPRTGGRLSFVYSDSRVTIENDEYLTIHPLSHPQNGSRSHEASSER